MYRIKKEISFEAAHQIVGHVDPITGGPGKCSRLHGHHYVIAICVEARECSSVTGFVIDYYWIGSFLKLIHQKLDHQNLNEVECIAGPNSEYKTTAERIARVVHDEFIWWLWNQPTLTATILEILPKDLKILYTECCETPGTSARYYP